MKKIKYKGKGIIVNGDCLEVMKTIPDKSIDLIVTDCPYTIISGGCTNKSFKMKKYLGQITVILLKKVKYSNIMK